MRTATHSSCERSSVKLSECGYIDLQINGFVGVDFNDPQTAVADLERAAVAMSREGVRSALPTVITSDIDCMCRCISNLVNAISCGEAAGKVFHGLHIEGPFLSPEPGYIGAHPAEHAIASCPGSLERLLDAACGYARLVTLAPEIDVDGKLTRQCIQRGCAVAAGHTNASLSDLERTISAGMTLFTHLGNGCPKLMDRHDNIIYRALRFRGELTYTLIADGFHIPELLFRNLLDWIDHENLIVVSDAISAAGLGPGTYPLGQRSVTVGADGAARDPGGQHFVGSATTLRQADHWLANTIGLDSVTRQRLLCDNPLRICSQQ
jgi:N-acetylglucosamine-6-phosphate deacetylase